MVIFYLLIELWISTASADLEVEVLPIVKENTPGELLSEDWIVPSQNGESLLTGGTGSMQNALESQISVPLGTYGNRPGSLTQVRGLGPSAEDVDVQALGLSLNPPQGGGLNLSIFPQFLWSTFSYQSGPPLNSINPTAATGTLSLLPWSAQALSRSKSKSLARVSNFYSTGGGNQISVASRLTESSAGVVGYSSDRMTGPSAGLSSRWDAGKYHGKLHLLATDLDTQTPGSTFFPSPLARTRNTRFIPLLQNDLQVTDHGYLKASVFTDWYRIDYKNPEIRYNNRTQVNQWGTANSLTWDLWKFGLSLRQIQYRSETALMGDETTLRIPIQTLGNFQASRSVEAGAWLFEPTAQGVWTTGYGLLPQGSLGVRLDEPEKHRSWFSRLSFSRRIPSLLDRFFSDQESFIGNPNLRTEQDWTAIFGSEIKHKKFELMLQSYAQLRNDARVLLNGTVDNFGTAAIIALTGTGKLHLSRTIDLQNSSTLSQSRLFLTQSDFPYVPAVVNVSGIYFHSLNKIAAWLPQNCEAFGVVRTASNTVYDPVGRAKLPGYALYDIGAKLRIWKDLEVSGRIENLLARPVEMIRGYPLERNLYLGVTGEI